jgi:nitrogen fixation protein NifZ
MIDPRTPIYEWGQRVRAVGDLRNDGTYPGLPENALLVSRGEVGEIVQVGAHTETNTPVYLVEFKGNMVVGCFEEEISLVEAGSR